MTLNKFEFYKYNYFPTIEVIYHDIAAIKIKRKLLVLPLTILNNQLKI